MNEIFWMPWDMYHYSDRMDPVLYGYTVVFAWFLWLFWYFLMFSVAYAIVCTIVVSTPVWKKHEEAKRHKKYAEEHPFTQHFTQEELKQSVDEMLENLKKRQGEES